MIYEAFSFSPLNHLQIQATLSLNPSFEGISKFRLGFSAESF